MRRRTSLTGYLVMFGSLLCSLLNSEKARSFDPLLLLDKTSLKCWRVTALLVVLYGTHSIS